MSLVCGRAVGEGLGSGEDAETAVHQWAEPEPQLSGLPDFVTPDVLSGFAEAGGVDTISTDLGEGRYALVCLQEQPGGTEVGAWVAQPVGVAVAG